MTDSGGIVEKHRVHVQRSHDAQYSADITHRPQALFNPQTPPSPTIPPILHDDALTLSRTSQA